MSISLNNHEQRIKALESKSASIQMTVLLEFVQIGRSFVKLKDSIKNYKLLYILGGDGLDRVPRIIQPYDITSAGNLFQITYLDTNGTQSYDASVDTIYYRFSEDGWNVKFDYAYFHNAYDQDKTVDNLMIIGIN